MSHDPINSWVEQAKHSKKDALSAEGVRVIRSTHKSTGNAIMDIAEKLRPWIIKMFEGARDQDGLLVQPARVRAIALNVAQRIVKEQNG